MDKAQMDRMSILIAAYKNADLVKNCLDSMIATFDGELPETVVVDDAAGDPVMKELVEGYAKYGVKFTVMPANGGFAGANNHGYRLCTKEFVTLVNTDIVFHENPFPAMLEFMDSHPSAGIIQGTLLIRNGEPGVDGCLNGCGAFLTPLGTTVTPGWLRPADDPAAKEPRRCLAAYGAMFMFRRRMLDDLGDRLFYDFFHTYYEEVDFCHRANLAGWEVWYVPTPPVDHAHNATMTKFYTREDVLRKFYRNMRFSFLTCFGLRGLLTIVPVFEFLCLGQILSQLLRFKFQAFRAHAWALWHLAGLCGEIRRARRQVQGSRVLNDTALFRIIIKNYTWREFVGTVKGSG